MALIPENLVFSNGTVVRKVNQLTTENPEYVEQIENPMGRAAFAYGLGIILALAAIFWLKKPLAFYGAARGEDFFLGQNPREGLGFGFALAAVLIISGEISMRYTHWGKAIARMLRSVIGMLHPLDALLLALLSSFGEELIFRGVLLPYAGLYGSSFIFGLLHLVPRKRMWVWSVWAVAAGLALGWLAVSTGGLMAPTLAHFGVNFVGLYALGRRKI
jgi:membrane protease YdiL (CAAX protease family)